MSLDRRHRGSSFPKSHCSEGHPVSVFCEVAWSKPEKVAQLYPGCKRCQGGICKNYLRVRLWAVTGFIHQWFDWCNTDFRQQSRGRDNQLSKWEVFQSFLSSWFVQIGNGEVSHGSFGSQVWGIFRDPHHCEGRGRNGSEDLGATKKKSASNF